MEKFVPYEKASKKERRRQDSKKRGTWGGLSPITRKPQNSKAYNRKKAQNWKREASDSAPFFFLPGSRFYQIIPCIMQYNCTLNREKFNCTERVGDKIFVVLSTQGRRIMYDLGLRLKQVRTQRGMTQKSLARQINKSVSAVSSYESNAQMPPLDVLVSIATVLRVSLDYLAGFDCNGIYTSKNLTPAQKELLDLLFAEFVSPSDSGTGLSSAQVNILQKLILLFLTAEKAK